MNNKPVQYESIKQYLAQVCGHVKARDVHQDIELEMRSHLDELVEDKLNEGLSEEEAVRAALAQMGDPDQIGKQLHAAHKPVMEWGLALLVAIMVGIGLLAMYAMEFAYTDNNVYSGYQFFLRKAFYSAVGVLFIIGIYFLDYQKWKKYSWHIYSGTVLLMIACSLIGIEINGAKSWIVVGSFSFDVYTISSYLLMVALAGTLLVKQKEQQGLFYKSFYFGKMILLYVLVPTILYSKANSYLNFILYFFGLMILMLFVAKTYKLFLACMGSLAAAGVLLITMDPYRFALIWERYTAFLRSNASEDASYMMQRSLELIRAGGMWGQGFGVESPTIRYIYSEMVFTYLIYSLGWVFGIAIVMLSLLLIGKVIGMARKLKDAYARGLVVGLFSIIGLHFVWNILMSFGLLPMNSMTMPFVSFGGMNGIIELMVMGLVLSVHRRKNMVSLINREPLR
ncbi:FtsW/RodA/SpoVE family cell cycle protein [Bacillus sp. FJAT-28004]|uniref:FtsW/RodA/SpoVE family cell cycle protein n=1 Tax=Bacillus sp. FJAT-28004 TaxID=1679165 RepID=UPI0006B6175C|nr:FtsW/RodA/SpoVE family cell cycle protein [Bacillus sp. FJAT-28004]